MRVTPPSTCLINFGLEFGLVWFGVVVYASRRRAPAPSTRLMMNKWLRRWVHLLAWYLSIRPCVFVVIIIWSRSDLEGNHDQRDSYSRHAAQNLPQNAFQAPQIGPFTFVVLMNQSIYSPGTRTCGQKGIARGFGFRVSSFGYRVSGYG